MTKLPAMLPISQSLRFFHHSNWDLSRQGLTQTFMSSGPQDHQLRGSGGPTIFLVVLKTTNVATLGNLKPNFFTLVFLCFHERHDVRQFKMMIHINVNNSWPSWLRANVLSSQKGERGYSVSGIITSELWRLFISLGHVTILDILVVHRTTDMNVLVVRHNFWWSRNTGPPSVVNAASAVSNKKLEYKHTFPF